MHIAVTGGTGFVGGFVVRAAVRAGHRVTLLARREPENRAGAAGVLRWSLGEAPDLAGVDALVHSAFAHRPGRYRGGEGGDPAGFLRANRDGSLRLFEAAQRAAVPVVLQFSTRAVFDGYPPGTVLTEDLAPRPTSLYGEMKAELEAALTAASSAGFSGISLRATGVYGIPVAPGQPHKWSALLAAVLAGRPIPPRVSTEVHGDDLAAATLLLLEASGGEAAPRSGAVQAVSSGGAPAICHASDIVLDHHDLVQAVARILGRGDLPLPARADPARLSVLDCSRLNRLGWKPGGWTALERTLEGLLDRCESHPPEPNASPVCSP